MTMAKAAAARVRRAGPADRAALVPLFERFYREEGFDFVPGRMAPTLDAILSRDDTAAFVAEADGEAVGAAAVSTAFGLEAGLYAEIEDLYVLPEWRRRGIGEALVAAALEWARAQDCRDVEVVLTPAARANQTLRSWYGRLGFADTGRTILERILD